MGTVGRGGTAGAVVASLAAAFVLAFGGGSAAADGSWLPAETVSVARNYTGCGFFCTNPGAGAVDVAIASDGTAVASWVRRNDADTETVVQASVRPAGDDWGTPQDIGTTDRTHGDFLGSPTAAAIADDGTAIVAFSSDDGVVEASIRPPAGSFEAPAPLSSQLLEAGAPVIAMNGDGDAIVAWLAADGSDSFVQAAIRPAGGAFTSAQDIDPENSVALDVAINDSGAMAVTWTNLDPSTGDQSVRGRVRPAGGLFAPIRDLAPPDEEPFSSPNVVIDALGRATAVWQWNDPSGEVHVQARSLDDEGALVGGVDDITEEGRRLEAPTTAIAPDGSVIGAWSNCATGGDDCGVESAVRPAGGEFETAEPIADIADGGAIVDATVGGDGYTTVGWRGNPPGGIQAARKPEGGTFGPAVDLGPATGQFGPLALDSDAEGNVVAAWAYTHPLPTPTLQEVQAAIFDAPAPPPTPDPELDPGDGDPDEEPDRGSGSSSDSDQGQSSDNERSVLPLLSYRLAQRFITRGRRTRITRLLLRRLPVGTRAMIVCRGKRCPLRRRTGRTGANGQINVAAMLRRTRNRFRAGQVLDVWLVKKGYMRRVLRYRFRRGRKPKLTALCVPAGGIRPQRRC